MTPRLVTEFLGTFFLVLIIGLCVTQPTVTFPPIAIGLGLMALVYMGGPVSGAHYNPAVTLAIFLRGRIDLRPAVFYVLVQLVASVAGALVVKGLVDQTFAPVPANTAQTWPIPADPAQPWTALAAEGLFTFLLALVVLNVATAKKTEGNSYYGVAIGCTVMVGAFAVGKISGGAFNPAVGFGPALAKAISGEEFPLISWIYFAGPLVGAAAAAMAFRLQRQE